MTRNRPASLPASSSSFGSAWRPAARPILIAWLTIGAAFSTLASAEVRQITWDDLLPKGWIPPSVSVDHFFDTTPAQAVAGAEAPVVVELDGTRIKLPGYLVPITMEGESLKEFLMVPYFGACIHVPPPPPNQVVFVRLEEPVQVEDPYGPHWVTGVLSTALSDTELAEAAYTMAGEAVEVFDWDALFPNEDSD
jgi:hypothetical protein